MVGAQTKFTLNCLEKEEKRWGKMKEGRKGREIERKREGRTEREEEGREGGGGKSRGEIYVCLSVNLQLPFNSNH